ncbi:MAG: methyltransferase domain-containing protein [Kofleriaceae bacterium]|nr:methyltransferase domain-containing protein [Kofleriaceae bacterium]
MDVFGAALGASGDFLRAAAIDAAYELGIVEALAATPSCDELADAIGVGTGRRRMRVLLDVLAALGVLVRVGDRYGRGDVPARPVVPRVGWGLMADVIRRDKALPVEGGEHERRMHEHLATAGAAAARELAPLLRARGVGPGDGLDSPGDGRDGPGDGPPTLLDLGGGAGAYTAAFLDAYPDGRATLVDFREVITLARQHLARFGDRVRYVPAEISVAEVGEGYSAVLLANVVHLHGPAQCAKYCVVAARAVAPGGVVVVKDLRMDEGRVGPIEGLLFALNMAMYTGEGDVYEASRIGAWLVDAGLVNVREERLAVAADAFAIVAEKPRVETAGIERELVERAAAVGAELPGPLRRALAFGIGLDRADRSAAARERLGNVERHYLELMPGMRADQLAGVDPAAKLFLEAPLDWSKLPRMSSAIDRLYAVLAEAGVDGGDHDHVCGPVHVHGHDHGRGHDHGLDHARASEPVLDPVLDPTLDPVLDPSQLHDADAFRANTPTLAAMYARTHYGACMPLLYGYPADLAYFRTRGSELGLDVHGTIDRYLTVPMIHELCHFGRERDALPIHLDECIAGWLGVHVWPEFAYPEPGHDDAIFAAPWLSQIGQAIVRAFGIAPVVRAHTGAARWRDVLPAAFVDAAERLCLADWMKRRTLHFLSDTLAPRPWIALAFAVAAGWDVRTYTPGALAELSLLKIAPREDAVADRAIVEDALRAMCLDNVRVAGSFRARSVVPGATITIDASRCTVTRPRTGDVDVVDPSYWLPPSVAGKILVDLGPRTGYRLRLSRLDAIPEAARAICAAPPGYQTAGFALEPVVLP